ncbi:MAG TPA: hypothetical protein VML55_23185 [Planctomycetaceae bacterium]|nr:hypothetical protein [Planctomycetaceae bacterium]
MVPKPETVGLWICERVLIEESGESISLIATQTRRRCRRFPTEPLPLSAFCILTGGRGRGTMTCEVTMAEELTVLRRISREFVFPDPPSNLRVQFRLRESFPEPGFYSIGLHIDGELIALRHLHLVARE